MLAARWPHFVKGNAGFLTLAEFKYDALRVRDLLEAGGHCSRHNIAAAHDRSGSNAGPRRLPTLSALAGSRIGSLAENEFSLMLGADAHVCS